MNIRIISVPPGEAPAEVRAAWVGLVLPVIGGKAGTFFTAGVLSRSKTWYGALFARLAGRGAIERGYRVDARRAVEILSLHSSSAAGWWHEHAALSLRPGQQFIFAAAACEEVAP